MPNHITNKKRGIIGISVTGISLPLYEKVKDKFKEDGYSVTEGVNALFQAYIEGRILLKKLEREK